MHVMHFQSAELATCHMCADKTQFITLNELKKPLEVTLGDGFALQATGRGTVFLNISFAEQKFNKCKLRDVLYKLDLYVMYSLEFLTGDNIWKDHEVY